jgi:hypothetical protein
MICDGPPAPRVYVQYKVDPSVVMPLMLSAGVPGAPAPATANTTGWQSPFAQVPPVQLWLHVPQFAASFVVSTQPAGQDEYP